MREVPADGCRALWLSVINTALADARSLGLRERGLARRFLLDERGDWAEARAFVCALAGVEPDVTRARAIHLLGVPPDSALAGRRLRRQSHPGSRALASSRRLAAAKRRRDRGEPPLPTDAELLAAAGERPNPRSAGPPAVPGPRTRAAQALGALRQRPLTRHELAAVLGVAPPVAAVTIDDLRFRGYVLDRDDEEGRYWLGEAPGALRARTG